MEKKLNKPEKALDYVMAHPGRVLVGGAVIGIGSFILYRVGKNIIESNRRKNTESKLNDSPEVQQATLLRNAMNPSGISWMMSFDTTDKDKIYDTAKSITKLDDVIVAYRKLYSDDLVKDLQNELTTEEYQNFLTLITSNPQKSGSPAVPFAKKNQMVVAKKAINVRSTPDASNHGAIYESSSGNNILFTTKPGDFIGYATGKQELDTSNNVKFIQVGYLIKKENLPDSLKKYAGKSYTMWVSSSKDYVDIYDYFDPMFKQYPNTKNITAYKKPLDYYSSSVHGLPEKVVVSIADTSVMDSRMKPYITVEKQVLLGKYIGTLDTGKGVLIKFRTIDNTERWVNAKTVKIYEQ